MKCEAQEKPDCENESICEITVYALQTTVRMCKNCFRELVLAILIEDKEVE